MNMENFFNRGWRPFIGWICSFALLYQYIGLPILNIIVVIIKLKSPHADIANFPTFITRHDNLWQLIFAMLGMVGIRSFEKMKGVGEGNKSD